MDRAANRMTSEDIDAKRQLLRMRYPTLVATLPSTSGYVWRQQMQTQVMQYLMCDKFGCQQDSVLDVLNLTRRTGRSFLSRKTFTPIAVFTRNSSYAVARLSHRNTVRSSVRQSVCPSVTRVDQLNTVQARITKSSPSAAWKTLVSGTVKLFHKFERGHLERRR